VRDGDVALLDEAVEERAEGGEVGVFGVEVGAGVEEVNRGRKVDVEDVTTGNGEAVTTASPVSTVEQGAKEGRKETHGIQILDSTPHRKITNADSRPILANSRTRGSSRLMSAEGMSRKMYMTRAIRP
jgi:hypothetical protein